jgi:hypothetical protein
VTTDFVGDESPPTGTVTIDEPSWLSPFSSSSPDPVFEPLVSAEGTEVSASVVLATAVEAPPTLLDLQ